MLPGISTHDETKQIKPSAKTSGVFILALLAVSTAVFGLYLLLATQNHFSQLEPMIDGTAPRPYVYRILAPFTVRALAYVTNISPLLAAVLVMYMSMIGFSVCMLALARLFLPPQYVKACALLAPVGLIPFLLEQRHIYDFPTLFLFTLAIYFLAKQDFPKYIPAFVLATLSKETSILLMVFFVLQFRELERRTFMFLLLVQPAIYALIRLSLIYLFRNNPGSLAEFHLYDHLSAYALHPVGAFLLFGAILMIVGASMIGPGDHANFVRNSLLAIGGPLFLLYFFLGVPFELRVFLEAYPSIWLTICLAAIFLIDRSSRVSHLEHAG